MTTPILGIDIDGVLADFNFQFINFIVTHLGEDRFPEHPFEPPTWDYPQHYGYTDAQMDEVYKEIGRSSFFWELLKPYPNIRPVIDYANHYPTYFITSRFGVDVKGQTERWLMEHGVIHPTVLISAHKGYSCKAIHATHYIDDRTENCIDVRRDSPTTHCTMIKRAWNKDIAEVPRMTLDEWVATTKLE